MNQFIDVAMRTLEMERPLFQALEWSLNEISDNVMNHSESSVGGFVQLTTYRENKRLAFCVADAGRTVLNSLKEAIPLLRSDKDAIADAVRAGVTRNKDVGQGNGLSGTLKIAVSSKGSLNISSGAATWHWTATDAKATLLSQNARFDGTIVDVQIPTEAQMDLGSVLSFGVNATPYHPVDLIENQYLSDDSSKLTLKMIQETSGFGSRRAGAQMRTKSKNFLAAEPACLLVIDWDGIQMISSSFADEFIGKLFADLGPMAFMGRIRQINPIPVVHSLLDRAIMQRLIQEVVQESQEEHNSSTEID